MRTSLLLFDIDGTLMHSGGAGMRAMVQVTRMLFGEKVVWDGIETAGSLDPIIFSEFAVLNGLEDGPGQHVRFRDHYLHNLGIQLRDGADRIRVMPGIHALLGALRRRVQTQGDVTLGLLTGNYTDAVPTKFAAIGIDLNWFPVNAYGDEAPTRPDLTRLAMDRYERLTGCVADSRRVVVIGDTPRDVDCAHAHGCVAFAVATGKHSRDELLAAGADHAVEDLADPTPLFELIDAIANPIQS